MMKSTVTTFGELLSDIDQHEIVLSDQSLVSSLRNIRETLQRIISKYDLVTGTMKSKQPVSSSTDDPENKSEKQFSALNLNIFSKDLNMFGTHQKTTCVESTPKKKSVDDKADMNGCIKPEDEKPFVQKILRRVRAHCEDSDDEMDNVDENKSTDVLPLSSTSHKKLPKLENSPPGNSNVNEGIEEIAVDSYRCIICKVSTLPKNNVASHKSGKQHQNNLKLWKNKDARDASLTRIDTDINSILSDMDPALTTSKNGDKMICIGSCYYCYLCNVALNSIPNLKQHVEGSKHKRLCETEAETSTRVLE